MSAGLLGVYVLLLIVLATLKTAPMRSVIVQRLRALFPSWRFFDDLGDVPMLWLRVRHRDHDTPLDQQAWQACLPVPRRRWSALLYNAEANLRLAYDSLLMQLLDELEAHAASRDTNDTHDTNDIKRAPASALVAYQLTEQLVAFQVARRSDAADVAQYQFKVVTRFAGAGADNDCDVLLSPTYTR